MTNEELEAEFYDDLFDTEDDGFDLDDDDFEYDDDDDAFFGEYLDAFAEDDDFDFDDDFEYDDDDDLFGFADGEDAERRRRRRHRRRVRNRRRRNRSRRRRPVTRARRRPYVRRPRPQASSRNYATKTEMAEGFAKARKEVLRNAKGIKQLDARISGVATAGRDGRKMLRIDTDAKLKKMKADMARQQQMAMLLPLLTSGDEKTYTATGSANGELTLKPKDDGGDSLLPLLLLSGNNSGGGSGGGNNDMMMMLALSGSLG